jgi:Flp pilus assembly protein TadD
MSRYSDSEWGYNEILARDPTNPHALRGRALVRSRLGRSVAAGEDLDLLLSLDGPEATNSKIVALYDALRIEDGYRLVVISIPGTGNLALAQSLRSLLAMFEFVLGHDDRALELTDELVRDAPGRASLHELRALILCDMGRFDEARLAIGRALAGAPTHPEFLQTAGVVERTAGNPAGAVQRFVDSAVARPNDPRARAELAACQIQLGLASEARAALETLPQHALRDPFVLYARAALAAQQGPLDEASRLLRDAARSRPQLGVRATVDPLFTGLAGALAVSAPIGHSDVAGNT